MHSQKGNKRQADKKENKIKWTIPEKIIYMYYHYYVNMEEADILDLYS
jgi:hypothetical protein